MRDPRDIFTRHLTKSTAGQAILATLDELGNPSPEQWETLNAIIAEHALYDVVMRARTRRGIARGVARMRVPERVSRPSVADFLKHGEAV